jgi:hypothetical protein
MKTLKTLAIALFITLTSSCQNNNNTMLQQEEETPEFQWEENISSPLGYPVEIYRGGFELPYVSLNQGTTTGEWGSTGGGMSYGIKPLPREINCIWVSYAERCHYKINTKIDYIKLLKLFQEGYPDSNRKFGKRKTTFNIIKVGFAPGGVVVIWATGPGRQVEIGRYKGNKFEVPQAEIDQLDSHESLLFSPKEYTRIMQNERIVPLEVRKANEGKPIPYGLWDSYRTLYHWRPVVEVQDEGKIDGIGFKMFNGEFDNLFDDRLKENKIEKRAVPNELNFGWRDKKDQDYGGSIHFDYLEISKAYKEICKENQDTVELVITINHSNNFATALLKQGEKKIRFSKVNVNIFKARK